MFTHKICIPEIPTQSEAEAEKKIWSLDNVLFDRRIDDLMKPYLGVLMTPFGQFWCESSSLSLLHIFCLKQWPDAMIKIPVEY